jgi:hypothetical protein
LDTTVRQDFEFKFISGKMYAYGELEQYYMDKVATLDVTSAKIGYNFDNPGQFIEIGKIWIGAPFSYEFDGVSTHSGSAGWGYRSGWCCQSDWGLKYNMLLSPTMGIMAGYTTGNTMTGAADGNSLGVSWWGVFGPLQVRAGIDNETAQDKQTKDAETYAASFQYAGVMFSFADTMSVGLDYQMKTVDVGMYGYPAGETWNDTEIALLFKAMQLGPGGLYVQYATDTRTASYDSDYELKDVYTNVFYKIPVDKGVGIEILYLSKSSTTKTAAGTSDATGPTTVGGGFYARF